ncbi:MAG TPA: hypothetical protein VFW83_08260 [Bryobacteraceae bacterium]|nr:hypothetical protein [Bryobacteraceae bacterium]
MASSTTTDFSLPAKASALGSSPASSNRRRSIDPTSGRALEILGHAIEYLTDELGVSGGPALGDNPQVEAIQLLMSLNRQIYLQCPEVKTIGQRCRSLLRLGSA